MKFALVKRYKKYQGLIMEIFEVFQLVFIAFVLATAFFCSFVLFGHFLSPAESSSGWAAPVLVVTGMGLSLVTFFWVPVDFLAAYKMKKLSFGLNIEISNSWKVLFVILFVVILLSIFMSKYLSKNKKDSRLRRVLLSLQAPMIFIAIYFILFVLISAKKQNSNFPVPLTVASNLALLDSQEVFVGQIVRQTYIPFSPPAFVQFVAPLILIGCVFFSIFGAVGSAMYPLDALFRFIHRPRVPDPEDKRQMTQLIMMKRVLRLETEKLIKKGNLLFSSRQELKFDRQSNAMNLKREANIIRNERELSFLADDINNLVEYVQKCDGTIATSPIDDFIQLFIAIIFLIFSLVFVLDNTLHIKMRTPIFDFILMMWVEQNSVMGLIYFLLTSVLFSAAANVGYYKFTQLVRPTLMTHEFRKNKTFMDSFLVYNTVVIFSVIGFLAHMVRTCPQFFSHLSISTLLNQAVAPIFIFKAFHRIRLFEITFTIVYCFCFLVAFYAPSSESTLKSMVRKEEEKMRRAQKQLEELKKENENLTKSQVSFVTEV